MEELRKAKARYENLMERVEEDMEQAERYKRDLTDRYRANAPLEQLVAIQSQVLRIQDYITQKFNNLVEILRSYEELCNAIKEAEAKAE